MLERATIENMEFEEGDSVTFYNESNIPSWEDDGYIFVRKGIKPGENDYYYVMHKPSRVMITWWYQGHTVTEDKKRAITTYYANQGKHIKRFTRATYERFKKELESGQIIPYFSKYRYGDIFFLPK